MVLTADEILNLSIGLLFLIPVYISYKNYARTGIKDFLMFLIVFSASFVGSISNVAALQTDWLIFYQLNVFLLNLTFFALLIHGFRLKYSEPPKWLIYLASVYFAILSIFILLWKIWEQPESGSVLFIQMKASTSPAHPLGAGLRIGGQIIYSTSFYIIGLFLWAFSIGFLIWSYLTVEMISEVQNIVKARIIWLTVWFLDAIWIVFLLPFTPNFDAINILILIGNILIVYNLWKYPESMLISSFQLLRYRDLYNKVNDMQEDKLKDEFGMDSLVNYLQNLPDDLVNKE